MENAKKDINNMSILEWEILKFLYIQKAPVRYKVIIEEFSKREKPENKEKISIEIENILNALKTINHVERYNQKWKLTDLGRKVAQNLMGKF